MEALGTPLLKLANADAVVFDFDGVLADSEEFQLRIWAEILSEDGLSTKRLNIPAIAGIPDRQAIENSVPGLTDEVYERLLNLKMQRCRARLHEVQPVPGAEALLTSLQGYKQLHICSSSHEANIREFLNRCFPKFRFDEIVGVESYTRTKPAPDSYLTVLKRRKLRSCNAIAIEDSEAGAMSAYAAGLQVIWLDRYDRYTDQTCMVGSLSALVHWREAD